jgi:hypothetical protein
MIIAKLEYLNYSSGAPPMVFCISSMRLPLKKAMLIPVQNSWGARMRKRRVRNIAHMDLATYLMLPCLIIPLLSSMRGTFSSSPLVYDDGSGITGTTTDAVLSLRALVSATIGSFKKNK